VVSGDWEVGDAQGRDYPALGRRNGQQTTDGGHLKKGIFITIEGIDGSGKSTQHRLLVDYLRRRGWDVVATREPGSTKLGEQIRRILLGYSGRLGPVTELALFYAARAQHLEEVIRPELAQGKIVISDRYNDASMAYQGYARGLGPRTVRRLDKAVCADTQPGLTILLDLEARIGLERAQGRSGLRERFEAEGVKLQQRARRGYLSIARKEPGRVKVVDGNRSVNEIQAEIRMTVDSFLGHERQSQKTKVKSQK